MDANRQVPDPESGAVARIVRDVQDIYRGEIRLALRESGEKARQAAKALPPLAAASIIGFFAGVASIVLIIGALFVQLPLWLSVLLMAVMLGGGALGAYLIGRLWLEDVDWMPQQTLDTVKENLDWAKTRTI